MAEITSTTETNTTGMYPVGVTGYNGDRKLSGRKKVLTDETEIDESNVVQVLKDTLPTHRANKSDIDYLYNYYKGIQPILERVKDVRPEINNKIVVNRAYQIVDFKDGYLIGEPIQYISSGNAQTQPPEIVLLNNYMNSESKSSRDTEIVHWFHICGTSFRCVLPDADVQDVPDEAPFEIFTLDPRCTYVVRHNGLGEKPVMGVTYITTMQGKEIYSVYTPKWFFRIKDDTIIQKDVNPLGMIPIIEYPANAERLGSFETIIAILDAINTTTSDRVNGIDQFVDALMVFMGVDIKDEEYKVLKEEGAIAIPKDTDIKYIINELNQQGTETLVNSMWQAALEIVGLPNRNGGSSTSDTGVATIFRDGWSAADAVAKAEEASFRDCEKKYFLPLVLKICNDVKKEFSLKISEIEPHFTRRNYENITAKSQVLISMLNNDKIDPLLAFQYCGMFPDPELAYDKSMANYEKTKQEEINDTANAAGVSTGDNTDGSTAE